MLWARVNTVRLVDFGFTDSGFQSPDPENRELLGLTEYAAQKNSIRVYAFRTTKRLIDIAVSATLLTLLAPLMFVLAVLVRMTSRGPAIFSQERLTEGGRVFRMLKFRSMRVDAEQGCGPMWAEEEDPRVTPIGRFLRVTHLDELPQFINVLKGDMSLIGPRPERPEFSEELEAMLPNFRKRLAVKGGITGLAQISSGYASNIHSYRRKLSLDLMYVRNCSLLLDLSIALKTVVVLLSGDDGAR